MRRACASDSITARRHDFERSEREDRRRYLVAARVRFPPPPLSAATEPSCGSSAQLSEALRDDIRVR
jgi:hypothetical protein